jgi:hypothetical protein
VTGRKHVPKPHTQTAPEISSDNVVIISVLYSSKLKGMEGFCVEH